MGRGRQFHEPAYVLRGRIITFQAGAEAEAEFFGSCPEGDEDDRYQIALMCEDLALTEDGADALRRHTRRLVRRHRAAIERVADALMDLVRLSTREVDALVWSKHIRKDYFTLAQLRRRLRVATILENLFMVMRVYEAPRGYLFTVISRFYGERLIPSASCKQ
jgi:hypothetical protein